MNSSGTASRPAPGAQALEPDVARFVAMVREEGISPLQTLGVAEARKHYLARRETAQLAPVSIGDAIDDSVAGRAGPIPVRRYLPATFAGYARPTILFFHGGGWVVGDLDSHDSLCRHVVRATGLQLVAVDYRRAPENPYPAAVEDAVDAHAMLLARAEAWRVDPQRLVVMGDSVGGTLATIVALHARDMCLPIPRAQILFYPVTDMLEESDSFRDIAGVPLTGETLRWFRRHYLPGRNAHKGAGAADWRLSPLRARSLAGSPPTFITVAGHDPLHDEGMAYASRLYTSGIPITLRELPGQIHGYLTAGRYIAEATRSIEAAAAFVSDRLD